MTTGVDQLVGEGGRERVGKRGRDFRVERELAAEEGARRDTSLEGESATGSRSERGAEKERKEGGRPEGWRRRQRGRRRGAWNKRLEREGREREEEGRDSRL
jgi:hypothetical protein